MHGKDDIHTRLFEGMFPFDSSMAEVVAGDARRQVERGLQGADSLFHPAQVRRPARGTKSGETHENAVALQSRLVEEAEQRGEESLLQRLRAHLALYQNSQSCCGG